MNADAMKGKRVLVTGASGGIGLAICRRFADLGARVWGQANRQTDQLANQLDELPGKDHVAIQADLRDPEQVERLIAGTIADGGRLDVLVNSAGVFFAHPPDRVDYSAWQRAWQETLSTNLVAAANTCFCASRVMTDGGTIVNISSRGAFRGEPESPAYAASKAGMNAMSQSLAQALAAKGIFVFILAPGFVDTPMAAAHLAGDDGESIRCQSPLRRVATPDEVAYWAGAVVDQRAGFATGSIVDINGASYLRS